MIIACGVMVEVATRVFVSAFAVYKNVSAESVFVCARHREMDQLRGHIAA